MTTLYVAGPMTGIEEWNYPAFNEAAEQLRAAGYEVINPAENPAQKCWEDYMRLSVVQVATVDGIALLPRWEKSEGATLERHIAGKLGMPTTSVEAWIRAAQEPTA